MPAKNAKVPLERMFGTTGPKAVKLIGKTRQVAKKLGLTFHVGSQTTTPEAYFGALEEVRKHVVKAGVVLDCLDVGGGFPSIYAHSHPAPMRDYVDMIRERVETLPVREDCRLMCEPGRALVAEAESLIVRVNARRNNELFINDGAYGALFDAAHLNWVFPVRHLPASGKVQAGAVEMVPYSFWGPTCDSIDHMKGPFLLPASVKEGDYLEIGNIGAYGRAIAGRFNGYGAYEQAILEDEPALTMFGVDAAASAVGANA